MRQRVLAAMVSLFALVLLGAGLAANMLDLGWTGSGIWDTAVTPPPMTRAEAAPPAVETVALRPDDAAVVAAGRKVYRQHCASCHGLQLQGQPNWRERRADGRLPAPPHDDTGHTWHHPDTQLFDLTKYGPAAMVRQGGGDGYESDMPAYEGVLTDAEIVAVLSYIKSTWPAAIRARHDEINARAGGS